MKKEQLFKLIGTLVLFGSFAGGWVLMSYQQFVDHPLSVTGEAVLEVRPGSSLQTVARELAQRGYIDNARFFVWMARWQGMAAQIKAGEYTISTGTTPPQLLQAMVHGRVRQYSLTLLEGWNFHQMMQEISASPYLDHTLKGLDGDMVMARLGHNGEHPEGRFYPDTYHFPRGLSDADFLQRAYQAMAERLDYEWAQRSEGLPLKNAYEALILASIVEKETGLSSERPAIAGVFIRRMQKGMRLQTDPTVIYGIGLDFDGNLRRRDLITDTPYNTYTRKGLPPTPIAMPGGEAIHAALHPDDSRNLYFVARGDGSHHFSPTLEEHNRAVIKYQLKGRERGLSSHVAE